MDATLDPRQARCAAALAAICTTASVLLLWWAVTWTTSTDLTRGDGRITGAFSALACLALIRLAWICLLATLDLIRSIPGPSSGESAGGSPGSRTTPSHRRSMARPAAARSRAATLFLALAALLGPGAAAAQAASTPHAVSAFDAAALGATPASLPDTPALQASPVPGFVPLAAVPFDLSSPGFVMPDAAAAGSLPGADPAPGFVAPSTESLTACPAPTPGWIPAPSPADEARCRLVMSVGSGERTPANHVVLRGQTLWSIAAAHLPSGSSVERIADAVQLWIEANPAIARHPDVLRAGDVLLAPTALTSEVVR